MVHSCCAIGCSNSSDLFRNVTFHRFPLKNMSLLQKWTRAVRRKNFTPNKSTKICSDHFVENDYFGKLLKRTAVPSIFNFDAANQGKSKKILAEEEDIDFPEELQLVLPELCILPGLDAAEQQLSPSEPINIKDWDPVKELGLDSNKVELNFEDDVETCFEEQSTFLHSSNSNIPFKEKGTQTFLIKCKMCLGNRDKFRLLRKQIKRRENRVKKLQSIVASLKEQIADSKKRKIKIVGNNVILIDKLDNNKSLGNISVDEQYEVALKVL